MAWKWKFPPRTKKIIGLIMKRILCLPIEYFKREFETRCYLASVALSKGYSVVIGDWYDPSFRRFENCVFILSQGFSSSAFDIIKLMERNGNVVYFHDEEGLQHMVNPDRFRLRIGKTALDLGRGHLAWSESHAQFIKDCGCQNVLVTGSPKYDIMRKFYQNKFSGTGKIKVFTRFTSANVKFSPYYTDTIDNQKIIGAIHDDKTLKQELEYQNNDIIVFNEFQLLIKLFGEDGRLPVSIRVHHNENRLPYDELAAAYQNIEVEDEFVSLLESLQDAKVLILDGCTTSTDARILRGNTLPIISLRPTEVGNYGSHILNSFANIQFQSASKLFHYLKNSFYKQIDEPKEMNQELLEKVAFNTSNQYFSSILFKELDQLAWSGPSNYKSKYFAISPWLYELKYFGMKDFLKDYNIFKNNTKTLRDEGLNNERKFPTKLYKRYVYNLLKRFYFGKIKNIKMVRISEQSVLLMR